jgi:hypothetical protein
MAFQKSSAGGYDDEAPSPARRPRSPSARRARACSCSPHIYLGLQHVISSYIIAIARAAAPSSSCSATSRERDGGLSTEVFTCATDRCRIRLAIFRKIALSVTGRSPRSAYPGGRMGLNGESYSQVGSICGGQRAFSVVTFESHVSANRLKGLSMPPVPSEEVGLDGGITRPEEHGRGAASVRDRRALRRRRPVLHNWRGDWRPSVTGLSWSPSFIKITRTKRWR